MASYFIGVDVGTGSARAGIFDLTGRMVSQASRSIEIYRPQADFVEQSSDNIWQAVCNAVRDAINQPWTERFPDPASRPARHTQVLPTAGRFVSCDFLAYVDD